MTQKYVYLGGADDICNKFFGTTHFNHNSYDQDGNDLFGSLLSDSYNGKEMPKKQPPCNVEVTVKCSIAEFYSGSIKNIQFSRAKIGMDGRSYTQVNEEQKVQVKPGDSSSTILTYRGRGNEEYGHSRSDLVVKLTAEVEPACQFTRSGDNLIYTHTISLVDSFDSAPIKICTLDGRLINLNID